MPTLRQLHRFLEKRLRTREHYRKPVLSGAEAGRLTAAALRERRPFAVGKLGAQELACAREVLLARRMGWRPWWERQSEKLHVHAGLFPPCPEVFERFTDLLLERIKEMDLIGVWNRLGEAPFLAAHAGQATLVRFPDMEPFEQPEPWTAALEGLRVVVVSPFADSIARQYARRTAVWPQRPEMLPAFELRIVKAPLSDGLVKSPFPDWFAALSALEGELGKAPFDAALIGCGAFSLPLTVAAKRMGGVAFHLGGTTQILFGILGGRWETLPIARFRTKAWVRPSPEETPEGVQRVESGAYW